MLRLSRQLAFIVALFGMSLGTATGVRSQDLRPGARPVVIAVADDGTRVVVAVGEKTRPGIAVGVYVVGLRAAESAEALGVAGRDAVVKFGPEGLTVHGDGWRLDFALRSSREDEAGERVRRATSIVYYGGVRSMSSVKEEFFNPAMAPTLASSDVQCKTPTDGRAMAVVSRAQEGEPPGACFSYCSAGYSGCGAVTLLDGRETPYCYCFRSAPNQK